MKIGIISDTHNYFDPQIPALFKGVEHILHAGDIGLPAILLALERIAPVTAVSGNTDEAGLNYRQTQEIKLAGRKFLLHHIITPQAPAEALRAQLASSSPDVVVFGHTHKPCSKRIGSILFFNPGYAGKSRFGMERTLAIMDCSPQDIQWAYYKL
jgi:uncharacterized protein